MADQKHHLREAAIEAISDIAQHLPLDCQMFLVVCRPGKADFDLVLPSPESNLNNALDALRRQGLSIDGDNAYKRDLLDAVVGALALGAQNRNPPPAGHWGQRFWDIGREERAPCEELVAALSFAVERWTILANEFKHTTPEHERELAEISKARSAIAEATQ
ncbi:hypothetical protein BK666_20685 [Pseudomonas frederiksbergensis]|uniref:Uncharacterized protein n=1 Tax=Pseudomonas frederiksbergensis TaxID=104087 RepID=A0A423JZR8_9PSED|nr:hypothetical protein [Pseudomonas frederiksbergensis]RON43493.1 hypothetical protein BK666_20685 [Pseudomonas frederiksbergensis]